MKKGTHSALLVLALAQFLQSEGLIAAPAIGSSQVNQQQQMEKVNLNVASIKQLQKLPGIEKTLAIRIVERRKFKPYINIYDLQFVAGIGRKKFIKIRPHITVK